jgi:hypothetical protein
VPVFPLPYSSQPSVVARTAISQVAEARRDPANYYLYVVDHVADPSRISVRIIHGDLLTTILNRTPPTISYWATFRTSEYDSLTPS